MSKELEALYTPLQSLNNIRYNYFHNKDGLEIEYFWFNRVENALKDYQELKQINIDRSKQMLDLVSELTKNSKKLKALEIIKEILNKVFDISFDNEKREIFFNDDSGIVFSFTKKKEEYDLLKEVLL